MAKKTRKQKQRAAARRAGPVRTTGGSISAWDIPRDGASTAAPESPSDSTPTGGDTEAPIVAAAALPASTAAPRRRIERLSQAAAARPGRRGPTNTAAMFQPLDNEDAAIPFDRVPYVPADLRRVAIIAGLMVLLIIIAAFIVTNIVK
ncbi:MAG: hypothetical protein JOY80_11305 [Candidatus Dormibacteraeota bacterium]|nr:hypothetical protein [Candidatus Dormibacteraeota bacterium]